MTVAIAFQVPRSTQPALEEAVRQATFRGVELIVIHIADTFDLDDVERCRAGISEDVAQALSADHIPEVAWRLELSTPERDGKDVAGTILHLCDEHRSELLVIGARRRSPVGKALMGSLAQNLILDADIPVLVVKAE